MTASLTKRGGGWNCSRTVLSSSRGLNKEKGNITSNNISYILVISKDIVQHLWTKIKSSPNIFLKIKINTVVLWPTNRFPCRWNTLCEHIDVVGLSSWCAVWPANEMDSVTTLIYSATWLAGVAITYVIFCLYVAFMRSRWATYFTWAISPDVPPIVAGTCHPWAVHRTQNKHTSRKYLCSSFLVLWFVIAMKDEIFLKTKIFFIAPTWPQSEAAPWTETSTDSLSTRWKSTREVFTTTLSFVQQGGLF